MGLEGGDGDGAAGGVALLVDLDLDGDAVLEFFDVADDAYVAAGF
jgi:hypothetical protein